MGKKARAKRKKRHRQRREQEHEQSLLKGIRSQGKWGLATALVAGAVAASGAIGAHLIDLWDDPAPTTDTRSVCAVAYLNVSDALELGIKSEALLEKVNPEDVDEQCGEESAIADDIRSANDTVEDEPAGPPRVSAQ